MSHKPLKHSVQGSSAGQPGKVVSLTVLVLAEESPSLKQAAIAEAARSVQDLQDQLFSLRVSCVLICLKAFLHFPRAPGDRIQYGCEVKLPSSKA